MVGNSYLIFKHPAEREIYLEKERVRCLEKGIEYVEESDEVDWEKAMNEKTEHDKEDRKEDDKRIMEVE
jgi:hypothetical protein